MCQYVSTALLSIAADVSFCKQYSREAGGPVCCVYCYYCGSVTYNTLSDKDYSANKSFRV